MSALVNTGLFASVAARRADALRMRVAGYSLLDIGRRLAADPDFNSTGEGYPQGYGADRYARGMEPPDANSLYGMVGADIARALKDNREAVANQVGEMRQVEGDRIDELFRIAFDRAMKGDLKAITAAVQLMRRRAALFGLDMPVKTEVTFTDDELDSQLASLIEELAEGGQDPAHAAGSGPADGYTGH